MTHKPFVEFTPSNHHIVVSVATHHQKHLEAVLEGPLNRLKKRSSYNFSFGAVHYTVPNDAYLVESVLRSFRTE